MKPGRALLLVVTIACGKPPSPIDAGVDAGPTCLDPDAGVDAGHVPVDGGDYACAGQAQPPGAVASFTVDGFVTAAGLVRNPVGGALVELFSANGSVLSTTTTSEDGGRYLLSTEIDCQALDGYVRASKPDAGFFDVYYYPSAPWRRSRAALELVVFDSAARALVSALGMVTIQNGTAALALGINDCAGDPIAGATVTTVPMGDVRYVSELGVPSGSVMATTSKGQLLVFNLPPGSVEITATVGTRTLRVKTVEARVDAITSTTVAP